MPESLVRRIPDDWTVWAFSDPHGVTDGLLAALQAGGLVDDRGRWCAPERTALVGCGDYIDRGPDVKGTVDLLRRLEGEAAAAGGGAYFARGNHEQMVLYLRDGRFEWVETWIRYGGATTLSGYGVASLDGDDPDTVRGALDAMERSSPGIFAWLEGLDHAIRWRDAIFVHGGLPIDRGLQDLGTTTDEHVWIREGFFETPWESDAFERYRRAGIERVVFGHTPQTDGPAVFHGGRSLCIDTNAVGNPDLPSGAKRLMTLVRLPGGGLLDVSHVVTIDTGRALTDGRRAPGG